MNERRRALILKARRALEAGRRVIVSTTMLGAEHEVTLRYNGEIYYCDTPARLHKHESAAEMKQCLRNQGYADEG